MHEDRRNQREKNSGSRKKEKPNNPGIKINAGVINCGVANCIVE
jgi:hypothetical protein